MSRKHKGVFLKSIHRTERYQRHQREQATITQEQVDFHRLYNRAARLGLEVDKHGDTIIWHRPDPHRPWETETLSYRRNDAVELLAFRDLVECYASRQRHYRRFRAEITALHPQTEAAGITVDPAYQSSFWIICHHPSDQHSGANLYYCYDLSGVGMRNFRKLVRARTAFLSAQA